MIVSRKSPPRLGGVSAKRTGWLASSKQILLMLVSRPPRPSATPPNLGGDFRHRFILLSVLLLFSACSAKKEEAEPEAEPVVSVGASPALSTSIQLKIVAEAVLYPI